MAEVKQATPKAAAATAVDARAKAMERAAQAAVAREVATQEMEAMEAARS